MAIISLRARQVARRVHGGTIQAEVGCQRLRRQTVDLQYVCQRTCLAALGIIDTLQLPHCLGFFNHFDPCHMSRATPGLFEPQFLSRGHGAGIKYVSLRQRYGRSRSSPVFAVYRN